MIYFDNAATTFPKPEVVYQALDKANRELAFNAGRGHYDLANRAFSVIEEAREYLCNKANAKYLVFTPSATHALNQLIDGLDIKQNDVVYCSVYDHNAIARTLHAYASKKGFVVKHIPIKEDNSIDLEKFKFECVLNKPRAIFCTHVSNVTGYVLPIKEMGKIAKEVQATYVVDGAQAFGLVPVNLFDMDIDYYVFAGHKTVYGSFGVGGYFTNRQDLDITLYGGTGSESLNLEMPKQGAARYEPSSPNVVSIIGLYEGARWTFEHDTLSHEKELFTYAYNKLKGIDGVVIHNNINLDNTGILSFNLEGYSSEDVSEILSKDFDICTRGGYHCCPFIHDYLDTKKYLGTVRVSFSYFNSIEEINKLAEAVDEILLG